MLFLSKSDIAGLVSMNEAIDAVEKAFLKHAQGKSVYPPKTQFILPTEEWRWWAFMPCYIEEIGLACKIVSEYPENRKRDRPTIAAIIVLCHAETGEVIAIMDGTYLTAVRTGALGALAARYLAREAAKNVGIIGCGVQARTQLEGLTKVRHIERARIYDLNEPAMDKFSSDMQEKLGIEIEKSNAIDVLDCDIVVTATFSKTPVVFGKNIMRGTHVTSIGAHTPDARELDDSFLKKAKIVIDSPDARKSGDLKGISGEIIEIKDVVAGKKVRTDADDITLFKSVGTALQDVAIASLAYDKAKQRGIGTEISL